MKLIKTPIFYGSFTFHIKNIKTNGNKEGGLMVSPLKIASCYYQIRMIHLPAQESGWYLLFGVVAMTTPSQKWEVWLMKSGTICKFLAWAGYFWGKKKPPDLKAFTIASLDWLTLRRISPPGPKEHLLFFRHRFSVILYITLAISCPPFCTAWLNISPDKKSP